MHRLQGCVVQLHYKEWLSLRIISLNLKSPSSLGVARWIETEEQHRYAACSFSAAGVGLAWRGEQRCFLGSWAVSPGPGWGRPLSPHSPAEFHRRCQAGPCRGPRHCCQPPFPHTRLEREIQAGRIWDKIHIISELCLFIAKGRRLVTGVWSAFSSRDDKTKGTIWGSNQLQEETPIRKNLGDSAHRTRQSGGERILNT